TGRRGPAPSGNLSEDELALPGWDRGAQAEKGPRSAEGALGEERGVTQPYKAPPGLQLKEVQAPMTITCHASPDAGWPTLKAFLEKIEHRLTVAMYDFTAPHIRDTVATTMKSADGFFQLILDPGLALGNGGDTHNPKKDDVSEDDIREEIEEALGDRL